MHPGIDIIIEDMQKIDVYFHTKFHLHPSYDQFYSNLHEFNSVLLRETRSFITYMRVGTDNNLKEQYASRLEESYKLFMMFIPDEAFV